MPTAFDIKEIASSRDMKILFRSSEGRSQGTSVEVFACLASMDLVYRVGLDLLALGREE